MKKEVISIHQPSYFSWLGLLHKINQSDLYIYMDDVQLSDSAYQHRNLFLTAEGGTKYLTVNFEKKNYKRKKISELSLGKRNWQKDHKNFLVENYKKHPYFNEIYSEIEPLLHKDYQFLNEVLYDSMEVLLKLFNIETKIVKMSEIQYDRAKVRDELVIDLVERMNVKTYLSGTGARAYMQIPKYNAHNIDVIFQDFTHPIYNQINSQNFLSGLSSLDMLFNEGIENSRNIFHNI